MRKPTKSYDFEAPYGVGDLSSWFKMIETSLKSLRIDDLPGILLDRYDIAEDLPNASGIYFLISAKKRTPRRTRLLYIGKAVNIRSRWTLKRQFLDSSQIYWDMCHHRLKDAVDLGDVTIRWWFLPREQLTCIESLLIQLHLPPWNSHRC